MNHQTSNGYANQGYVPNDPQEQNGQWAWYRQYPAMEYAEHPSSHHHRMMEEILYLTREHHRLLREIHQRLHHGGKPSQFSTAETETMTFGVPTDMREKEPRP